MMVRFLRHVALFCAAWLLLSVFMTGCVCVVQGKDPARPRPVYVAGPPPPVKQEVIPQSPSSNYVWVPGYWDWNEVDNQWIWEDGRWAVPPQPGYVWQPSSYQDQGQGDWIYTPGQWVPSGGDTSGQVTPPIRPSSTDSTTPNKPVTPPIRPSSTDTTGPNTPTPPPVRPTGSDTSASDTPATPQVRPASSNAEASGNLATQPVRPSGGAGGSVKPEKVPGKPVKPIKPSTPDNKPSTPAKPGVKPPVKPPETQGAAPSAAKVSAAKKKVAKKCKVAPKCNCDNKCDPNENQKKCGDCL
ncbi:MAG: hypothetical protein QNJ97_02665 [Myxococcota bacterium]|nr:hypothetical protein [Myxococcota bacterium]